MTEQGYEVLPTVRDAKNEHVIAFDAVDDDVITDGKTAQALASIIISGTTDPGMTGAQIKSGGDGVDLPVGNVLAAAIGDDVVPDMVQVGAGLG
jgi:hypothetical protein